MSGNRSRNLFLAGVAVVVGTALGTLVASDREKVAEPEAGLTTPTIDRVLVKKRARKMYLVSGDKRIREYEISLGDAPEHHKEREGDERTPEGAYVLDWRNPNSSYYKSLHISYPNANDRASAAAGGYSPGGDIFIHGLPNGMGTAGAAFEGRDWTDGCIAINDNDAMEEVWRLVANGTPIQIDP